jgi:hypothetical protein
VKGKRRAGGLAVGPVLVKKGKMAQGCPRYRKPFLIFQTFYKLLTI